MSLIRRVRVVTEREQATSVGVLFRYDRGAFLRPFSVKQIACHGVGGRCQSKLSLGKVVVRGERRITMYTIICPICPFNGHLTGYGVI